MSLNIEWTTAALRQLRKIKPKQDQAEIVTAVDDLANMPNCKNVKHLTDHTPPYRLRVNKTRYRVFFTVDYGIKVVKIEEVAKRNERTYK